MTKTIQATAKFSYEVLAEFRFRLVPVVSRLGVALRSATNDEAFHVFLERPARRRFSTSSQGEPSSGLAARSARRSSRISLCQSGTGIRLGCAAMRSHRNWTYSICSSIDKSSKPGGGWRAAVASDGGFRDGLEDRPPSTRERYAGLTATGSAAGTQPSRRRGRVTVCSNRLLDSVPAPRSLWALRAAHARIVS